MSPRPHADENMLSVATNTETVNDPGAFNLSKWQIKTACSVEGPGTLNTGYDSLLTGLIWDFHVEYKRDWDAFVVGVSGKLETRELSVA